MKLFLLKNLQHTGAGETKAMVVVAPNGSFARRLASTQQHSHNSDDFSNGYGDEGHEVWAFCTQSSCEEIGLALTLEPGVLLTDFVYD